MLLLLLRERALALLLDKTEIILSIDCSSLLFKGLRFLLRKAEHCDVK